MLYMCYGEHADSQKKLSCLQYSVLCLIPRFRLRNCSYSGRRGVLMIAVRRRMSTHALRTSDFTLLFRLHAFYFVCLAQGMRRTQHTPTSLHGANGAVQSPSGRTNTSGHRGVLMIAVGRRMSTHALRTSDFTLLFRLHAFYFVTAIMEAIK